MRFCIKSSYQNLHEKIYCMRFFKYFISDAHINICTNFLLKLLCNLLKKSSFYWFFTLWSMSRLYFFIWTKISLFFGLNDIGIKMHEPILSSFVLLLFLFTSPSPPLSSSKNTSKI